MTVSLLSFDCSETSVVIMDHLGVLLDGDEGPDSQPDGPLPVDVKVFYGLSESSAVHSVNILKSTL